MSAPLAFLKFVAKAALNAVGGGIAGQLAVEVLPEIARDVWRWWGKDRSEAQRRAEVQALVQAPAADVQRQVKDIVLEVAGTAPAEQQLQLETYLNEIPSAARQSLIRRDDPRGVTVPPSMPLQKAEDLLPFLPQRLPRFKPGERPLKNVDWELVKLLGVGGFGEVWKARNPHFPDLPPVALKFCLDPAAREQLLKYEAGVLARVMVQGRHPGIVRLLHTYLNADPPCLEYEFIEGGDLAGAIHTYQAAKGPLPPDMATKIVLHLVRAVGHVHKLSPPIVHRDLKPANVLVRRKEDRNEFLITDFGIGGVVASQALEQTRQGTTSQPMLTSLKGAHTPLYASPEQKRGEPADPRDDVHALGVIWYQLLIGDFSEGAPAGGAWKKTLRGRGVSDKLLDLIESCFEARAEHRPPNAAAVAEQLTAILAEQKAERERVERERTEREKAEKERIEKERAEQEKAEREQAEKERAAQEQAERERIERERVERERIEQERAEREKAEKERIEKEQAERQRIEDFVTRGTAHRERGDADKAIGDFTTAIRLGVRSSAVYLERGRAYADKGVYDLALADYGEALRLDPNAAAVYLHRGRVYEDKKEPDRALADYSEAIRLDPTQAQFFNARGLTHLRKGDTDLALADLIRALQLDPGMADAYHNRGEVYARKGHCEQAVADYTQAIKLGLKSGRVYYHRGLAQARLHKPVQAIADFTRAIKRNPRNPEIYLMRGLAYHERQDYPAAIADFTRAIQRDKGYTAAYQNRGRAYLESGKYGKAVRDFTRVIQHSPRRADAYDGRAWAHCMKKQFDEAIADAAEAIRLNPVCASAYFHRGRAHLGKGELDHAIADATEAIRLDPRSAHHEARGLAYQARGQHDLAIADFTEAIRLDPRNGALYRSRGRAYAEKGDPVRAEADQERAHKLGAGPERVRRRAKAGEKKRKSPVRGGATLVEIINAGHLAPPVRLFRRYKGKMLEATLLPGGAVEFQGQRYDTCSAAAEAARATVSGRRMNTNGWTFWQYQGAAGKNLTLSDARDQVASQPREDASGR
jgi:tetratricopeptide (TPR) repeat protein